MVSSKSGSASKDASSSSSFWKSLDAYDKQISAPFFHARLPSAALEFAFSIPGNFFGSCSFATITCPALFTVYFDFYEDEGMSRLSFWHAAVLFLFLSNIGIWWLVLTAKKNSSKHKFARQLFYGPLVSAMGPFVGVALVHVAPVSEKTHCHGYLQNLLWIVGVIPSAILKPVIGRQRPAARARIEASNGDVGLYEAAKGKHFAALPSFLARDTFNSMPSGDAAGAMACMYALIFLHDEKSIAKTLFGILCILLSCLGRLYFLAHHLGDVLVGVFTSFLACGLFQQLMCDNGTCSIDWMSPLLAHGSLISVVILTRFLCTKEDVFGAGTVKDD